MKEDVRDICIEGSPAKVIRVQAGGKEVIHTGSSSNGPPQGDWCPSGMVGCHVEIASLRTGYIQKD